MPKRGNPSRHDQYTPRLAAPRRVHRLLLEIGRRLARASVPALALALSACGTAEPVAPGDVTLNDDAARVLVGAFESLVHPTEGTLRVEVDDDGRARVVFLDDFVTDNGPALIVGLTTTPTDGMHNGNAWPTGTIDLGPLQGASGAQAYDVPDDVDVDAFASVVVWCEEFSVAFGAASYDDETP